MLAPYKLGAITFNFPPVAASRPRVSRWGTYYAETYKNWMAMAQDSLSAGGVEIPADVPLIVSVEAIFAKARTSKLRLPRPDVDNIAKGPLDVITKAPGFWKDDSQINLLIVWKRFADPGEQARTEVNIYEA